MLAWAYARMSHHDAPLFDALARALLAPNRLRASPPQALAMAAWAFSHVRHANAPLFRCAALASAASLLAYGHARSSCAKSVL